jgi:hypothetical protein
MQVSVEAVSVIKSKYGGEVIRIDGYHEDEQGMLAKGYCFIDPKNDNWQAWVTIIETIENNRGNYVILDGVRMKKRDKGLWNADSKPVLVEIMAKPLNYKPKRTNNNFSDLF